MSFLEQMIVRVERLATRHLPAGPVFLANARIHRWKGEAELRELPRLVSPGSLVVDVGAHFGTYSHALSQLVGEGGRVISVEPIEEDANFLRAAARQLRLPMDVHTCALSSQSGEADLQIPYLSGKEKAALASLRTNGVSAGAGAAVRRVPVKTVDEVVEPYGKPVSFIKIDVEGHEWDVLQGARKTIEQYHPNMIIEIDRRFLDIPVTAAIERVLEMGYQGEFLDASGKRRPFAEFRTEEHQPEVANSLDPTYICNFIFTPISG